MSNDKSQPTTYIISEKLLKEYGNMSRNVGVDKVLPYLLLAQEYYFEPVLGVPLLTELKIQVSTDTLTEANKALILKIAPALALYTDYLAVRSMAYQINEKGVTKSSSENSDSVNEKELSFLIHQYRENADMAMELLLRYLCRCRDQYPLFRPEKECDCAKYTSESTGDADPNQLYQIYFLSGKRSKCPKCDRD